MELIFELLAEVVLQIAFEILAEFGFRAMRESFRLTSPILAMIGIALWGALAGAISLWPFPNALISDPFYRTANLAIAPPVAGLIMMLIGKVHERRGRTLVLLDRFGYAALFAFAMALIRYFFAQ